MEKKITFAVKGLIFKDNKFLIVKRNNCNPEIWETAEDTIIREMKEETGLTVKPLKLMDTWDSYLPGRQITGIIYKCDSCFSSYFSRNSYCRHWGIKAAKWNRLG